MSKSERDRGFESLFLRRESVSGKAGKTPFEADDAAAGNGLISRPPVHTDVTGRAVENRLRFRPEDDTDLAF